MQKLQRNFVESKMNKDLDDRFVPAGEYRDALNISIISNADSSSGAVQNTKGNGIVSELSKNIETKGIVDTAVSNSRSITFTEANDQLQAGMFLYSAGIFPELLTNGTFNTDISGWTTTADSGAHGFAWNSNGYIHRSGTTDHTNINQTIAVVSGSKYVATFRKKYLSGVDTLAGRVRFFLDLNNNGSTYDAIGQVDETSGDWVTSTTEFVPTFTGNLVVRLYGSDDGEHYFDDVSVKLKDTQPIILSVSDDKKTIHINTPVSMPSGEEVYVQYSSVAPNECVGVIEDEGEGSIYWMTSSRDSDDNRQFNFRNADQRSNINLVANGSFKETSSLHPGWDTTNTTVTNASDSDDFITIGHKVGNTSKYPTFYQTPENYIKLTDGKRYKFSYSSITRTGNCKIYVAGSTDQETGEGGEGLYRPAYDSDKLEGVGDREFYFIFDKARNNGSNYVRIQVELTQGTGGYAANSITSVFKIGKISLTEYNADVVAYQDTIFEYKENDTKVVANDIYMLEMASTAPQLTLGATPTVQHDAVTKDMVWEIVNVNDVGGVPHQPFNSLTHSGIVSDVASGQIVNDAGFTNSGWSNGDNTDTYWTFNNGASGTGTGSISHLNNQMVWNAVPSGKYLSQHDGTPGDADVRINFRRKRTYTVSFSITSYTAGKIRVNLYDGYGGYVTTPYMSTVGFHTFDLVAGSGGTGSTYYNQSLLTVSGTTSLTVDYVSIRDKHELNIASLKPYSGTSLAWPSDASAYKLVMAKPKVLDFNYQSKITGINIVEKMLFWTDGYSEPKKINIDNSILGTSNLHMQSRVHVPENNEILLPTSGKYSYKGAYAYSPASRFPSFWNPVLGYTDSTIKISREHVTVIKKAPHQPPLIVINSDSDNEISELTSISDLNKQGTGGGASTNSRRMILGNNIYFYSTIPSETGSSIKAGDTVYITQGSSGSGGGYDIKGTVQKWSSTGLSLKVTINYINPDKEYSDNSPYIITSGAKDGLYADKFVRFGYRYRYTDGEYSTFSPFSRPAFLPNAYVYSALQGVNKGMINRAQEIQIKGFVPQDIPADVVGVELLYKSSSHSNVYKMASFDSNSTEWNAIAYGGASNVDDGHLLHHGVHTFSSENLHGAIPSSQMLRSWDAVPRKAIAQEIVGNRLVYGNYSQGYDLGISGEFQLNTEITNVPGSEPGIPQSSCKSLRTYQVGIVYGDYFGRETPVLTTANAAVKSLVTPASGRLLLQSQILSQPPSWAAYYRHYVKESSSDYSNLVLDRWWAAEDDTVWLSFFSHDRNKLEEGDEIILKKKHGSDYVLDKPTSIKVLSIENEAPDAVKVKSRKVATYDCDKVGIIEGDTATGGIDYNSTHMTEHGLLGTYTPNALPELPRRGDIQSGDDYIDFSTTGWEASGFNGLQDSFYTLAPDEAMYIYIRRFGLSSEKYEVTNIQGALDSNGNTGPLTDRYRISLGSPMGADVSFIRSGLFDVDSSGNYNGLVMYGGYDSNSDYQMGGIQIQMYVEVYETEDYHEGRFFVKVEKTPEIANYVMCEGRNTKQKEVMEMRLPYLAHNANYYSDGTTGMSTTSPDQTPHASSVGNNSYISQSVWNNLENSGLSNGVLSGVTEGRKKLLDTQFVDGSGAVQPLTYAETDRGAPSHQATGDPCQGTLCRGEATWEDYANRWASDANNDFWFVDKEPMEASYWWSYQNTTRDPGLGTQLGDWTPLYADNTGSTTAAHGATWVNNGSAVVPGPANNWKDNNPARLYIPTTKSGGTRTNLFVWHSNYGQWQTGIVSKDGHLWRNLDGYDYQNSDFDNGHYISSGVSGYIPCGADVGARHMHLSWTGDTSSALARNQKFYNYVYKGVYGWSPQDTDAEIADQQYDSEPVKFYWREDPDKEVYTVQSTYYYRNCHNHSYSTGYSTDDNKRKQIQMYLDKPHGSGPSGWHPFYHATTNPSGAIDAGLNLTQPYFISATGATGTEGSSGHQPCPEFRTMVILDNIVTNTDALAVTNPAVFETVSKEIQDIDIYYEAGGSIPISVKGDDPSSFVAYIYDGSKIEIDYVDSNSDDVTFTSSIGTIGVDGRLGLHHTVPDDVAVSDVVRIYRVDDDGTSYTSYLISVDPGSGFTSIYIKNNVHGGWSGIPFTNCFNFQNGVESYVVKDLFNGAKMSKGVIVSTTLDTVPKEESHESGLIHSGIYNSKSGLNDFNQFIMADNITKDINPDYGSIQKLNTRDADMTVLCEEKIVRMLVNKNSLYNADGSTNVTASDMVLGQDVPYVGEYGISKNPESFVNYGYKSYFTDRNRGAVLRLSQDGLTTISKNGMEGYFDSGIRGDGFLIGTYDAKKYEYNLSLSLPKINADVYYNLQFTRIIQINEADPNITVGMYVSGSNIQTNSTVVSVNGSVIELDRDTLNGGASGEISFEEKTTVSFNDVSNGWSSFRSFIPEEGLSVRGEYFTYKNGALYQHYTSDVYNNFYSTGYKSSITAVFNDGPEVVKDFRTLEYLGSAPKNKSLEYGWFISKAITDVESGYIGSFVEKEGKYSGYIKGFNTGYTDPKQFTTQGLGSITKIENA